MWYEKKTLLLLYYIINTGTQAIHKHAKVTEQYSTAQYTVELFCKRSFRHCMRFSRAFHAQDACTYCIQALLFSFFTNHDSFFFFFYKHYFFYQTE